jgi:hypothetical protein
MGSLRKRGPLATFRIFLSHSSRDDEFGARLVHDLRYVLGSEDAVWYDSQGGLHGGDSWWGKIVQEVASREVFLLVLSPESMASHWVIRELDMAITQGKLVIPLLYRPCIVRPDLLAIQMISFLPPKPYEAALVELLTALGVSSPQGSQYAEARSTSTTQNSPKQEAQRAAQTATLQLIRQPAWASKLRAFHIYLEDTEVGVIREGESFAYVVQAGHHVLSLRIDWNKTSPLPFDISPGEKVLFICQGTMLPPYMKLWKQL